MSDRAADPLIVAIDGPVGVGKSTVATGVSRRLGIPYLETGAMYRAVAYAALERRIDLEDRQAVSDLAAEIDLELKTDGARMAVLVDGVELGDRLRAPEVGTAASVVAAYPTVRRRMVELQRASARRSGAVLEGRDIGTKVFPDTPHKFFLTAPARVRAERRRSQLAAAGKAVGPADALERQIVERDRRDSERDDSPLVCDDSYQRIDTSGLDAEGVVAAIVAAVADRARD